jgi:uncharacterized glyoxalase superfamily protein PhnB
VCAAVKNVGTLVKRASCWVKVMVATNQVLHETRIATNLARELKNYGRSNAFRNLRGRVSLPNMIKLNRTAPILRMFDEAKAREFYVGYLGFEVVFEHRFEPHMPLYMEVRRDGCVLHLSEHHGDASPGAAMRIEVEEIDAYCAELRAKNYRYAQPSVEEMPWGTRDMRVTDPFGNGLTFTNAISL